VFVVGAVVLHEHMRRIKGASVIGAPEFIE
jgi:hypothetical protein